MFRTRGIGRDKRQIESSLLCRREFALGAFSGFLQTLQRQTILAQVDIGVREKLIGHPIHDPLIKILAAEISVSRGRKNFEDTLV